MNKELSTKLVEHVAEAVHDSWVNEKQEQGIHSRPSAGGEEQMVPYSDLSESLKELDRITARAALRSLSGLMGV